MSRGTSRGAHDKIGFSGIIFTGLIVGVIWFGFLCICFGGLK